MAEYTEELPSSEWCDLMEVHEYLLHVREGGFIDYDGYGHPVKDNKADETISIRPSEYDSKIPKDATHICWFNR